MYVVPTLDPDVCPGLAEHVGGGAAVVAKVLLGHLADEQRVPVPLLLHVPTAVRVQQHRVLQGQGFALFQQLIFFWADVCVS